jgi:ribosomal protein S18 acetylase RimI-like enzyme
MERNQLMKRCRKKKLEFVEKELVIDLFNDPLVKRHMPLSPKKFDEDSYQQFIAEKQLMWEEHGFGPYAYFVDDTFIGWGGIQPDESDFELALVLSPKYWGYGKELYYDLIKEAFIQHNLESVTILFPPSRTRVKWILKQGFKEEAQVTIKGKTFIRFRLKNPNYITVNYYKKLPSKLQKQKEAGAIDYETSHGISVNYNQLSIAISEKSTLIGILNAYTAYAEIYIDDLWVDKRYRGQGYGRKLIALLKKKFEGKGFNNINLVTSEFQAPDFYKKCGFTQEFIRVNKQNPKLTKYFFVKFFDEQEQHQGILKDE